MVSIVQIRRQRRLWIARCKKLSHRQPPRHWTEAYERWSLDCDIAYARLERVTRLLPDEAWVKNYNL